MRIGIDARFYGEAGPGRYVKNVISHLEKLDDKNSYIILLRKREHDNYSPSRPNFKKILADYPWYSLSEQVLFPLRLHRLKLDLLYVPHFNIPILYFGKLVTAIPDIIMHFFSTEEGTTLPKIYYRFKKLVYYLVVWVAVNRSYKIIVPSQATKHDFLDFYKGVSPNKFVLAREGVDPDFRNFDPDMGPKILSSLGIRQPFLLYIGSMYKHKNVFALLEAMRLLKSKFSFRGQLVLVGKKDAFSDAVYKKVVEAGLSNDILMPGQKGYLSDRETSVLRSKASVYVFPSLKEGFSLTPLEAMLVGLPCAVSRIPCHEEIYADSALYFDPRDPQDIAGKVDALLKDNALRERLIEEGYQTVRLYNWDDTARITLSVFEDISKGL